MQAFSSELFCLMIIMYILRGQSWEEKLLMLWCHLAAVSRGSDHAPLAHLSSDRWVSPLVNWLPLVGLNSWWAYGWMLAISTYPIAILRTLERILFASVKVSILTVALLFAPLNFHKLSLANTRQGCWDWKFRNIWRVTKTCLCLYQYTYLTATTTA